MSDLPEIQSFHINPEGGENIIVEGGDRFCHERDVKAFKDAAQATIRQQRDTIDALNAIIRGYQQEANVIRQQAAEIERLRSALVKIRDCGFNLKGGPDLTTNFMEHYARGWDNCRQIARAAIEEGEG